MVSMDWAAVYAERQHDVTIKRIVRRLGKLPAGPVLPEQMAAVDRLMVRLAGRGVVVKGQHGAVATNRAAATLVVQVRPEQHVNELVGECIVPALQRRSAGLLNDGHTAL